MGTRRVRFANLPLKEEEIARHSGQPELVDMDYVEHCASHPSDKTFEQFDENAQVDITMQAVK
jgi:hypothetical protein